VLIISICLIQGALPFLKLLIVPFYLAITIRSILAVTSPNVFYNFNLFWYR